MQFVAAWKAKDRPTRGTVIANDYMTLNGEEKVAHKSNEMEGLCCINRDRQLVGATMVHV